eukprot:366229-Chlamydomonas_euryale.AAC.30
MQGSNCMALLLQWPLHAGSLGNAERRVCCTGRRVLPRKHYWVSGGFRGRIGWPRMPAIAAAAALAAPVGKDELAGFPLSRSVGPSPPDRAARVLHFPD